MYRCDKIQGLLDPQSPHLSNVDHVTGQCQALELQVADVRLDLKDEKGNGRHVGFKGAPVTCGVSLQRCLTHSQQL